MKHNHKPDCFDTLEQYKRWTCAAQIYRPGPSGYCADCTPAYQAEMRLQDRCAHPAVIFSFSETDGWEGRRPRLEKAA